MDTLRGLADKTKKVDAMEIKDPGTINVHHMESLDHVLEITFGFGLQAFKASRPCEPLQEVERRYFVGRGELPQEIQDATKGGARRAAIENTSIQAILFEVRWHEERRVLHEFIASPIVASTLPVSLGGSVLPCLVPDFHFVHPPVCFPGTVATEMAPRRPILWLT